MTPTLQAWAWTGRGLSGNSNKKGGGYYGRITEAERHTAVGKTRSEIRTFYLMFWMLLLLNIPIYERALHPLLSKGQTWEFALTAKYLSVAVIMQALMFAEKEKPLLYRSLIAVFCITAWVDFVGQLMWNVFAFDSALPVFLLFLIWLVYTAKRAYTIQGDIVLGETVFIMFLRPTTVFAVCKALVGFPVASVCIYSVELQGQDRLL